MKNIKISIITVCFNAEKFIEKTICSVLEQDYGQIEYIIIDGKSDDNTVQIIEKYSQRNKIKWISESDQGIYDAMNKGIQIASGDYIQFLNAGDTFCNSQIVEMVANFMVKKNADLYYGHIIYQHPDGSQEIRKYGKWCGKAIYFLTGDCINHQALFARKECFQKEIFDIKYKICGDREWMMRIKKDGFRFQNIDLVISNYLLDYNSASILDRELGNIEADKCIKTYLSWGYWLFQIFTYMRNNKYLSEILHSVYRGLFIRKEKGL